MCDPVVYNEELVKKARELAKLGRILVYGKFNEKMESVVPECIAIAATSLSSQNKEWATLHIDSPGGSKYVLATIRTAMFESGLKFRGLVEGNGHSCGFNLLQYCNWRVAFSNSRLLYHLGEAGVTLSNEQQVRFYLGEESRLVFKLAEIDEELTRISTRAGISVDTLLDIARKDYPILANEALKLGFLDEVISNPVSEKPPEGYVF